MKKSKFLALALVVSVMLMGAGYALWSQEAVIDETVNTGELKMEFVNYSDDDVADYCSSTEVYEDTLFNDNSNTTSGAVTASIDEIKSPNYNTTTSAIYYSTENSSTGVEVDINHEDLIDGVLKAYMANLHPGGEGCVKVRMRNTGTVSTQFTGIKLAKLESDETNGVVTPNDILTYDIFIYDGDDNELYKATTVSHTDFVTGLTIEGSDFVDGSDIYPGCERIAPSQENSGTGEDIKIDIKVKVDGDNANESNFRETQTLTFVFVPSFEQDVQ